MENIRDLGSVGARVHAKGVADTAGNTAQEFRPFKPGTGREARALAIERTGADDDPVAFIVHCGKMAPEPDNEAAHAAVPDQQVGADTYHMHRNIARQIFQKLGKVGLIFWFEEDISRSADLEPGYFREVGICPEPPAHRRHPLHQPVTLYNFMQLPTHSLRPPLLSRGVLQARP